MYDQFLIADITDKDFDPNFILQKGRDYTIRKAARGVVRRDDMVALQHVTKSAYHKLPGGGVENSETPLQAFQREILEEVGCESNVLGSSGVVLEYRDQLKELQINYVFFAEAVGDLGQLKLEEDELAEGCELVWVPIREVESMLARDVPKTYEGKFIQKRDSEIIRFYRDQLELA